MVATAMVWRAVLWFFHLQFWGNYDFTEKLGGFAGIGLRNIGFIYDVPNTTHRIKNRTYNLTFPVGIKIGNIKGVHIYGGYSFEVPFHFKEKIFIDGDKFSKSGEWFSSQIPAISHGVFGGIQLPRGMNIKFQYYLTNFHDQDYTDPSLAQPYQNFNVNVMYISLNFMLFKNTQFTLDDEILVHK